MFASIFTSGQRHHPLKERIVTEYYDPVVCPCARSGEMKGEVLEGELSEHGRAGERGEHENHEYQAKAIPAFGVLVPGGGGRYTRPGSGDRRAPR